MFAEVNSKQFELLEPYFEDPDLELSIRELSRRTDISPGWASKNVEELNQKNILNVKEVSRSKQVLKGEKFQSIKEIYNYWKLQNSGLIDFLEKELRPEAIVLFGSFERGEDRKGSDIDIAVIKGRSKNLDLSEYEENLLSRDIELHNIENLKQSDINFRNSLANGKTLYGFIEVI